MNHRKDYTGVRFGENCEVLRRIEKLGYSYWEYRCGVCGQISSGHGSELVSGKITRCKNCGLKAKRSRNFTDYTGYDFGGGKVIGFSHRHKDRIHWLCKCNCGKEFTVSSERFHKIKSCQKCSYKKMGESRIGENNHNYNPSLTEEERLNKRCKISSWKRKVKEKYNWTCVISGRKDNLVSHHIYNYKDYPELRYDVENGICIHSDLHKLFHKIYGTRNNTKDQFNEFIYNVRYL